MDRYLFVHFVQSFAMCFVSMVGLYIIIDLFANADEFLEDRAGTVAFIRRAAKYYFLHSFEYFGRLSPIITQVAAMVTLAQLHTNNEIVALLSAGVPTRRILAPVMVGALVMIGLGIFNREVILPNNSERLQRIHEDIERSKSSLAATNHIDQDKVLIRAWRAFRADQRIENVNITIPVNVAGRLLEMHCPHAFYRVDEETGKHGWLLVDPSPLENLPPRSEKLWQVSPNEVFLASNISFSDMTRSRNWLNFSSTSRLIDELHNGEIKNPQRVRILIHSRMMQPIMQVLLILIGIPFVLQWERKNIYLSIATSIGLSAVFFTVDMISGYFASYGYIDAQTAAWVPVFLFTPITILLFQRVGT